MFSSFNTLADILSAPGMKMWFHFLFLEDRLGWFPKELAGIMHECHYYPTGGHGCGLAYENSGWKWSIDMFSFLEKCL